MQEIFIIRSGLLEFKRDIPQPRFWLTYQFKTQIFGEESVVDHIVINFKNFKFFQKYVDAIISIGGISLDRVGIWPLDFCEELSDMPERMHMHFASIVINEGILVCTASIQENDDFDVFYKKRSKLGIHHIAFRVDDLATSTEIWKGKGFLPLGNVAESIGLKQIFLTNSFGQIIELIVRSGNTRYPFSCNNVRVLKLAEHEPDRIRNFEI